MTKPLQSDPDCSGFLLLGSVEKSGRADVSGGVAVWRSLFPCTIYFILRTASFISFIQCLILGATAFVLLSFSSSKV